MSTTHERKRSRSLFGPIVLIAVGVYFLLANMGIVESVNWAALFQLWPLWLIFLGVNLIVQQAPRPLGGILSAMVGVTAVALVAWVLFFAEDNPLLARLNFNQSTQFVTETVSYAPEDVSAASVEIDFGATGADLYALEDSRALLEGTVSYAGDLVFDTSEVGNEATVFLDTRGEGWWQWLNPVNWGPSDENTRWQLGLSPSVETTLRLDQGAGSLNADLSDLQLGFLEVEGGAGSTAVVLPPGAYEVNYEVGAGSARITLPQSGRIALELDGGAGSITLYLPASMAARIDVDDGAGSFSPDDRFTLVEGERNDNGVWETADYDSADDRVDITVDIGAGSVRILEP